MGKAADAIHIKPSHKGLFTRKAQDHHMTVQRYASYVLAHRKTESPATVKEANFARNASHWG